MSGYLTAGGAEDTVGGFEKRQLGIVELLYFRICARRANFSHLETLGFGYSSRQDAKNAKFGNLFYFAPLRLWMRQEKPGRSNILKGGYLVNSPFDK
jgi:hypothetical protein